MPVLTLDLALAALLIPEMEVSVPKSLNILARTLKLDIVTQTVGVSANTVCMEFNCTQPRQI